MKFIAEIDVSSVPEPGIAGYFLPIPFSVSGSLTTGVKKPVFIAPVAMTIVKMYAICDSGSGAACRPSKNKGTSDGTILSSIGNASAASNSQSLSLAAGDRLGVNVTTAGTGVDMSVTFWAEVS